MFANLRATLSVAAQTFLVVSCISTPATAGPTAELIRQLEHWIDANSGLPMAATAPEIVVANGSVSFDKDQATMAIGVRTRAYYEPETATITLVRPWDSADPVDVSVLLHELIHHRQAGMNYYCLGAQELPAYRLQEAWLAAHGLALDVNWIGIVLASSCAPRDIHPD